MLPTRLNSLSPKKQKNLQRTIFAEFTRTSLETMLFLVCVAGIFLVGGKYMIQSYFNDITETLITSSQTQTEYNHEIKDINNQLVYINTIQNQYVLWTPLLTKISEKIPKNVKISILTIDNQSSEIYISGQAESRTDLLELESNLESLEFIESISIPLSQLTDKENVNFAFKINYLRDLAK
jgi:Tfp pilus assembly protein PilN